MFVDIFDGASDVALYTLDEGLAGVFSVLVIAGEKRLTDAEVNQFRCDFYLQIGEAASAERDDYRGKNGMHGSGGSFSVSVDGIAVLVQSTLTEKQARTVAEALGGEDEALTSACDDSKRPRIAD